MNKRAAVDGEQILVLRSDVAQSKTVNATTPQLSGTKRSYMPGWYGFYSIALVNDCLPSAWSAREAGIEPRYGGHQLLSMAASSGQQRPTKPDHASHQC
jgi:hypothetical protein